MKRPLLIFCFFLLLSIISFFLLFNSEPVKFNTVTVEGKFSISVPEYLTRIDSIDPAALLQYQNEKEQLFLLVYEKVDTVENSFQAFFKSFSDDLIEKIGDATMTKYYPKEINGCNALIGNIRGKVNGTGVYYRIALIEAKLSNFKIIIGVSDDNRSRFDENINSILLSFTPAQ